MRAEGARGAASEVAAMARDCSWLMPSLTIRRRRNSVSSSGSDGRGCHTVLSLEAEPYTSIKPRWVMEISVPLSARRSRRGRNLSRSPVEYSDSSSLPSVERMKSWGSLARFSAQSVSMIPTLASACASVKPLACQKSRTGSQSWSAGRLTTSQRFWPSRSMRTSPRASAAALTVPAGRAAWPARKAAAPPPAGFLPTAPDAPSAQCQRCGVDRARGVRRLAGLQGGGRYGAACHGVARVVRQLGQVWRNFQGRAFGGAFVVDLVAIEDGAGGQGQGQSQQARSGGSSFHTEVLEM